MKKQTTTDLASCRLSQDETRGQEPKPITVMAPIVVPTWARYVTVTESGIPCFYRSPWTGSTLVEDWLIRIAEERVVGTKNNPGTYDCYANAEPDEPMFVLLGRDKFAPSLVRLWADEREADGEDPDKVDEARRCAGSMGQWLRDHGKKPSLIVPLDTRAKINAADNLATLAERYLVTVDDCFKVQGDEYSVEDRIDAEVERLEAHQALCLAIHQYRKRRRATINATEE